MWSNLFGCGKESNLYVEINFKLYDISFDFSQYWFTVLNYNSTVGNQNLLSSSEHDYSGFYMNIRAHVYKYYM